jgi:hypothetical protein
MSKGAIGIFQAIVNMLWKSAKPNGYPPPVAKTKLHGRRGYGDSSIPSPDAKSGES